jgi:hypothetical protein
VAKRAREARGVFYSPPKESVCWGVTDSDMSELRAGHVRQPSLETGLDTGHVRCRVLTRVLVEEPVIFGLGAGHIRESLLEPG